jgi:hypothetical protein
MHSLLVHVYHLVLAPYWRAPVVAFTAALVLRLVLPRSLSLAAALAVLAGWLAVQYHPAFSVLPAKPVDRLPGLAAMLLLYLWLAPFAGKRGAFLTLPLLAVAAGWWMGGAPLAGQGVAGCVPIVLGVWAALAVTRRYAGAAGWSGIGAALALAGAITLAHGSPHWARAAMVPACAGVALIGVAEATLPLAFATALIAAAAMVASNQGRFMPVDVAVLAPLLVWLLAPRVLPRLHRAGPALAAAIATLGSVALTLAAIRLLALR